jgi:signal recognition particle subunit SRP19
MRPQEKIVVWPTYFDQTKTRRKGRRVTRNLAVQHPKIAEIQTALERLNLGYEIKLEAGYSKTPWLKTGMIMIEKTFSKEQIIQEIAKQLVILRSEK